MKEIFEYRYAILFGLSTIIGFCAGIVVGLNSIN